MKYDFTVVGTAASVSVLKVNALPSCGTSIPVYSGSPMHFTNGGMGFNICAGLNGLGDRVYPVLTYADARQKDFLHDFVNGNGMPEDGLDDPPSDSMGTTLMIQDPNKNHMTLITEYEHRMPDSEYFHVQELHPHFFADSRYVILTAPLPRNSHALIDAIVESGRPLALSMRKDCIAFPHDVLKKAIDYATIIFANDTEAAYLVDEFDLDSEMDMFQNSRLRYFAVTLGKDGCKLISRKDDGSIIESRIRAVEPEGSIVDTVGAGDAFVSGFMHGLVSGLDGDDSALLGSTMSSFILEAEGSICGLPDKRQLEERFCKEKAI